MNNLLKAVIVGCGGMAEQWLKSATAMSDVQMVGFVDVNLAAAEARRDQFAPGAQVGRDLAEVLRQTGADMVFDVAIPEAHHAVTLTALAHGCHVLGEKPLANSMAEARELVAAAEKAGKLFAVIQNRRYMEPIQRLRAFLATGQLGHLTTVNCDFYIGAHFGGFRDRMKHVLLLDMAIHTFDQARFLTQTDPRAVLFAKEWNPAGSWYDHDASAIAIFEMGAPLGGSPGDPSDGPIGGEINGDLIYTYRGSWCAEGVNTTWEADWRIIGTQGSVRWNGGEQIQIELVSEAGGFHSKLKNMDLPSLNDSSKTQGHRSLIAEFVECVRAKKVPNTTASDNIKSLSMVFGAIESATLGKRIELA